MIAQLIKRHILILLLCTTCTMAAVSQSNQIVIPGLDLVDNKLGKTEVPFKYIAGYILLEVQIEGILPLIFIYDTGAEHTIIFEKQITDLLGIEYDNLINLRGADINSIVVAHIARKINLQIQNTASVERDIVVLEESFLNLKEMTGTQVDGIIGGSYFRNLIIEVDYKRKKLVLWHPDKFSKKLKGYSKSNLEIINNKPYLNCKTVKPNGEEFELKLLIDTGAGLTYLINTNGNKVITLPESATPGNLGKGIGGFLSGYKGKMKSLQFGEFTFNNILTHFQAISDDVDPEAYNNRDGLIGNLMLERFNIVINYLTGELFLKPNSNLNKKFKYNLSGMELIAFGPNLDNFIVFDVIPGSPAEEIGIQQGDIVKKVGLYSSDKYTLYHLDAKLSRRVGNKIKLILLRDDELIEKKVVLKDYLAI